MIAAGIKIFAASFVLIFLKAFQQQSVVGGYYAWVTPVSMMMALAECTIIVEVASIQTLWAAVPMGLGGGLGAMLGMYIHRTFVSNGDH